MSKYEKQIKESLDNNLKLVMENGPGLYVWLRTHFIAKCPTGKHVLKGGLGCMGVGQMWFWAKALEPDYPGTRRCMLRAGHYRGDSPHARCGSFWWEPSHWDSKKGAK